MENSILEMSSITLEFPGVKAVDNLSLAVKKGEVRAIVGENGAGKSSLMKVLSGVYPSGMFNGEIKLEGTPIKLNNINDAEAYGIMMIPQELNLVEDLSVAENLFLNQLPTNNKIICRETLYEESEKILNEIGMDVLPTAKVRELGVAQKQMIVIGRALWNKVKILILDEPTSTLSNKESEVLFEKVKMLKKAGVTCFYISHRLEEILEITDSITVMRNGRHIITEKTVNMDEQKIVSSMIGRDLDKYFPKSERFPAGTHFELENFNVYHKVVPNRKVVDNVTLHVEKGEIVGMFGLVGAGRTELALGVIGAWESKVEGRIKVDNKTIKIDNPRDAIEKGITYLPEDRKTLANIPDMSINENISVSSIQKFSKFGVIDGRNEYLNTDKYVNGFSIKTPSVHTKISALSGGNQQKCILSRQISVDSDVLIFDEPTQGVDVGAKTEIYEILNEIAEKGKAILVISSDLFEVMGISDRIIVMHEGKLVANLTSKEINKNDILEYATLGKLI